MKLMPLVDDTDMDASIDLYTKLLPASSVFTTSPYWTELNVAGASLAIHSSESVDHSNDGLALSFDAATTLEQVISLLEEAGIDASGEICAQPFGRSVTVTDPDGMVIQINEHSMPPVT